MAGRRTKLTPEIHQRIVAYVRAGAYTWVAAKAARVHPATFYRWMKRGEQSAGEPYRAFFDDVEEARAQARVAAEAEVHRDDAFKWLRYGPGRERAGEPGWTDSRQVTGADGAPLEITFQISDPRDSR